MAIEKAPSQEMLVYLYAMGENLSAFQKPNICPGFSVGCFTSMHCLKINDGIIFKTILVQTTGIFSRVHVMF